MKKLLPLALSFVMFFTLVLTSGCSWFATTIPEGFTVFNMNLGGMTEDEAIETLKEGIANYTVSATIDGDTFTITAEQIGMKFNDSYDLSDMVKRTNNESLTAAMIESNIITLDDDYTIEEGLREAYYEGLSLYVAAYAARLDELEIAESQSSSTSSSSDSSTSSSSKSTTAAESSASSSSTNAEASSAASELETAIASVKIDKTLTKDQLKSKMEEYEKKADSVYDATRAHIEYSQSASAYVAVDGTAGETKDYSGAVTTLSEAAKKFASSVTLTLQKTYSNGEVASSIPALKSAVENGNKYLTVTINYIFDVPEGDKVTKTLDKSNIFNYLYIAPSGREVLIDETALSLYASDITAETAKVTTTDSMNSDKTFTTTRSGKSANSNTVFNDIYGALKDFRSETFTAVYEDVSETITSENGSVYVYVDLDAQKVYLYENGEVTLTCDCVSGSVSAGHSTPDGVFEIFYKQRNATLKGQGYSSFVNYWMPFNGGIGLHDADGWRSSYGGNIYLYSGSHGCINLPKWAAATIYEKVSAGTRVIVVGGQQSTTRATEGSANTATTAATTAAATTTAAPANSEANSQDNSANDSDNNSNGEGNNSAENSGDILN